MTKRTTDEPIPARSSLNPDRRTVHLNLTAREYTIIGDRATIAGLSRPQYIREVVLAFQIYRTTAPADLLTRTTRAIDCARALARSIAVSQNHHTQRHMQSAMVELYEKGGELEKHAEFIAAALALQPPDVANEIVYDRSRLPGPGSTIWRTPETRLGDI